MTLRTQAFENREIIFKEGDKADGIFLIQDGFVEIFHARENTDVILAVLKVGDVIGTMTLISQAPRTASARAKGKCVLVYYPNEKLKQGFKEIPVWTQAIIKDIVARVKDTNEKLIEAALRERVLQRNIGTVYHHSAQLAYLLASFMRKATIMDDTRTPLYQAKNFLIQAEFILLKKISYLQKIFNLFEQNSLFRIRENQKYGPVILNPNPQILEDYANFSIASVKKGVNYFVPPKYYKWMNALVRISKKFNNLEQFSKEQLINLLKTDMVRDDVEIHLLELLQYELIQEKDSFYLFSPTKLQRTMIFESISRSLKDVTI
ncbi:MAG: cyclic nucleotide-binding domain-containing protein [Bdellovibrionota bacterium]